MHTYRTIKEQDDRIETLYEIQKSKFITHLAHVESEDAAREFIQAMKKRYFDARHNCSAYVLGENSAQQKSNDDGEPGGTAGNPILEAIKKNGLTNIVVVVTRYFGGQLLGVPGLINAYKTSAREALDNCTVVEKTIDEVYSLEFDYPLLNEVMRILKDENLEQQNSKFEMNCYLEISIRQSDSDRIIEKLKRIYGVGVKYLKTV